MKAKFVKNYLREKFKEDSDPIKDMGIGDDYHDIAKRMFPNKKVVFYHDETDEVESNIKNRRKKYDEAPTLAAFLRTKDFIMYIHNNKAIGWVDAKTIASHISLYGYSYVIGRLDLYKDINESLTEKFKEDSDPIEDMRIGEVYGIFKVEKKSKGVYYFVERGPNFIDHKKPTTYIYASISGNVYRRHPNPMLLKMAIPNNLVAAGEFILKHYLMRKKRLLKESLNEKFTDDSDPIDDMRIGLQPDLKDINRIKDIKTKARGSKWQEIRLAETMCKLIKDKEKAFRRYLAAELIGGEDWAVSETFLIRAAELGQSTAIAFLRAKRERKNKAQ